MDDSRIEPRVKEVSQKKGRTRSDGTVAPTKLYHGGSHSTARFTFEYPPTGDYLHEISFRERVSLAFFFQSVDRFFLLCEIKGVSRRVSDERQRRNWPNGKASNTVRLRIDSPVRRFVSAILLSHKTH